MDLTNGRRDWRRGVCSSCGAGARYLATTEREWEQHLRACGKGVPACDHEMADLTIIRGEGELAHPDAARCWVVERCVECDARRVVEHEMIDDGEGGDYREIAALPWRAV